MTSALENLFAFQLDSAGLTQYVREYQAIPGRKFRFDFAFVDERLLIEINGGTFNGGAHGRGVGINRDYEKGNQAEPCNQYLRKGSKVLVEGRLKPEINVFQRKDGTWGASYDVTAENVRFLDGKKDDAPVDFDVLF